jgi:HK97 family phage major capsid protein
MKKKISDLLSERGQKVDELNEIATKLEKENRSVMNPDELKRSQAIEEEVKAFDATIEQLKRNQELAAASNNEDGGNNQSTRNTQTNVEIRGTRIEGVKDAAEAPFKSIGEQLRAVAIATRSGTVDPRLTAIQRSASGMNESVPDEGGFLVQKDFSTELFKKSYETGLLVSKVRRIPLSALSNGMKINALDDNSRVTGSRYGGIRGYWANEAESVTASKPKFRQIKMELKKLMGVAYMTEELMADTTALGAVISQAFAEEFGFLLDDAILNGDGANKPLGILKSQAYVAVAKESGQSADTIVAKNIVNMRARLWARSRANSAWFINQDIEPQLHLMSMAVGTGGAPVYLPANGLAGQPYDTLYGRPIIPIEQASTLGDLGDIALLDLSQYLLIDKGEIQSANSLHVRFLYDEQVFRFTMRVDGQPAWNAPLTPAKGSNTQSPFIFLAERA